MNNNTQNKKRGLGKGLAELGINELLSEIHENQNLGPAGNYRKLPVDLIQSGRYQPRREFNQEALEELANSIRSQGIIQPLVVRNISSNNYEIIAGERRWRAAQLAGLSEVPVVVRDISDEAAMAMALIENIQREDLNPLEEATALQRLIDEFQMTHEQVSEVVGKARATVSNLLRLLQLNSDVKSLLAQNRIDLGHAKLLLALSGHTQSEAAAQIANKNLSVRETEVLIKKFQNPSTQRTVKQQPDPNIVKLQQNLSDQLGAAVTIQHQPNGKGQLIIRYNSLSEFEGIIEHFK